MISAQVQGCSNRTAAVAMAPVNLASAPDCCLPALIRLSLSSDTVDSGMEQGFSFRKES